MFAVTRISTICGTPPLASKLQVTRLPPGVYALLEHKIEYSLGGRFSSKASVKFLRKDAPWFIAEAGKTIYLGRFSYSNNTKTMTFVDDSESARVLLKEAEMSTEFEYKPFITQPADKARIISEWKLKGLE